VRFRPITLAKLACATEGQAAKCASASMQTITSEGCGATDAGSIGCVATDCQLPFDCTQVVH
jgi:hypothetical protein